MEIEIYIKKMKDIYLVLIDFIDAVEDSDAKFNILVELLDKEAILKNLEVVRLIFQLISKIADNHQRTSDFFYKLEQILRYFFKDIPSPISHFITNYRQYNKKVLFLLLQKGYVEPDESFLKYIVNNISKYYIKKCQSQLYLYPAIKNHLEKEEQKRIEEIILQEYNVDFSNFEQKCLLGENDSYICSLIRSDSIEDFVTYVNRTNLSLDSKIEKSIYETNSFLIDKEPTLIEYAAFFGSIQIIQHLKFNKVPLTSSLWTYAVHSNNAELIHLLEENEVKLGKNIETKFENDMLFFIYQNQSNKKKSFDDAFIESIKCHHNDISNYIEENYYDQIKTNFGDTIVDSLNFSLYPNEVEFLIYNVRNEKGFKLYQFCNLTTKITIPPSVTLISDHAFTRCSTLKQIIIPPSVTKIGYSVFKGCSSLTQITIPSSVTSIGDSTFSGCSSLTQITIPSSVTSIGNNAFLGCSSLIEITIPSSVTMIGNYAFSRCSSLAQVVIPSSVTEIGEYSFSECSSLTLISIPDSVTSINICAFSKCSSLTQITIPSSVTSLGNYAFSKCSSLMQVEIPSSVKEIGNNAFSECSSLVEITIPSSMTSIRNNAFSKCSSLKQITIPSSIYTIGDYAFSGCSSLTQVTIPSSVTSIGNYAFCGCSSLTQITIPPSVTEIGNYIFSKCSSLKQIAIPSSITKISHFAFSECSSLVQISVPDSVVSIGNCAFSKCSKVAEINLPSSLSSIGNYCFSECLSLIQISIPPSVCSIGNYAFKKCSSLTQITIPDLIENKLFDGCSSLKNIIKISSKEKKEPIEMRLTETSEKKWLDCKIA